MNSENSKISEHYRLILNLTDKITLKTSDKYVALSNLIIYYKWKNIKKSHKNNKFKVQRGMKNLDHTLYQIFKIRIYIKAIENRITFKIKSGYYLELLNPETMKLLVNTKNKVT